MKRKNLVCIFLLALLLAGACATFMSSTEEARSEFFMGRFDFAAKALEAKSKEDGKDQLLYLLDRGTSLQLAGDFQESEKEFREADHMTEVKDYVSLSTEAATLFFNDTLEQYKGEDFEKVLINAYLAVDYVLQGNYEDALVECRRVNEKLYKYKFEAKRNYEQNAFARYLSAVIWEASGHPEDAYIDYKQVADLAPGFNYLKFDLMKLATRLGRGDDLRQWKSRYGNVPVPPEAQEDRQGEIILIYQQGRTAVKRPRPVAPQLPMFIPSPTFTRRARAEVTDTGTSEMTYDLYNVSKVAIKTLDDAYAGLIAKRVAGVAAKYVVADQIAQKNQALGFLAWIGMNAVDRADLRQWDWLPETFQIARLRVPPGAHTVRVVGLDMGDRPTGESQVFPVKVVAGQKIFLNWRSLR